MSSFNGYTPPPPAVYGDLYGPEPYDYNFCFALDFARLETERVALTPLIPRVHAKPFFEQILNDASLEKWLPFRNDTLEQLLEKMEFARRHHTWMIFAVIDKGRGGSFAGITGLIEVSQENLSAEIGWVVTFPAFQRTYVTSNANGLLLRYCLDVPAKGGLGLRRIEWMANSRNAPSIKAATRMGLKLEGIMRWAKALPDGKVGHGRALREGDREPNKPGRDSALLAMGCDDWEAGGRELVQALIDRK